VIIELRFRSARMRRAQSNRAAILNILEIVVLLALALIVVGPERLPEVLRVVGKVLRELRLASNTVLRELTEELDEPRKTFRDLVESFQA